jgi:hypothetical protein
VIKCSIVALCGFLTVVELSSFLWVGENFLGSCDVDELFLGDFSFAFILLEIVRMPVEVKKVMNI